MRRCLKKSLALLLALLMALSAMSVMAMAADDDPDTAEAAVILDEDGTDENDVEAGTELECPEDATAPAGFVSSREDADQQEITTLATVDSGTYGSNLTWTLDSDGTLTVSGTGEMEEVSTPWRNYRDSITKIVVSEGVTSTSTECFIYCEAATSVSLPSTLVTIGSGTFYGCTSLTSITIPDHVTTIKQGAFAACTSLEDIHLGSSVQKIETYAFQNVAATNFMIPASVTSIDGLAFFDSNIGSFSAEANGTYSAVDGVLYTDNGKTLFAYPQGSSAASFTVPSGVTQIGDGSFAYAKNLTAISIPSTVTYLGESSFQHMYSLESVTIPDSVTEVGYFTFYGCLKLTTVTFGSGLESTIYEMFEECSSLTTINFGTGLKNIYSRTFAYCSSLVSVTLPANVESIGNGGFGECRKLTTFVSEGLTGTIAFQAFLNDTSLSSVTLNEGVTYIARTAFYGCSSLKSITLPASVEFVHFLAFPTTTVITNKNSDLRVYEETGYRIEDDVIVSGTNRYDMAYQVLDLVNQERNAEGLSSLVMDESLLSTAMMRGCEVSILFEHTRPDGSRCFTANSAMYAENIAMGYSSAASVVNGWMNSSDHRSNIMSSSYTTVGIGCFYINGNYYWTQCFGRGSGSVSCPQPANQTVSNTVSLAVGTFEEPVYSTGTIWNGNSYSFEYSLQLPSFMSAGASTDAAVYITGSSNTGYPVPIENSSFTFTSTNPGILTVSSTGTVRGVNTGTATINASLTYTTLSKDINVISDEIIETGMCGTDLTWALTSDGTLMIEGTGEMTGYNSGTQPWYEFEDEITTVVIGSGVTSIGRYAFWGLSNLSDVEIADTVTAIGYGAFMRCSDLTSITLPENLTSISTYAFCYCTSLTSIVIPANVTSIGSGAFDSCTSLTSITFEGSAPSFGGACFYRVTATAYYPCANASWVPSVMENYSGTITWIATGHTWGEVTWAWSNGYSSATASRTCENCGEIESQEARVLCEITNPTCTQEGKSVYTATAVFDNIEYTDVQTVAIPAAGHTWGNVTWNWAPDYSSATASRTCTVCGAVESRTATVTSRTTSPTCTDPGTIIYTATADFNGTSYSDTAVVETEPALGHDWGDVVWTWSSDHSSASASRTCIVCGTKETVNAAVTSQVISEPTEEQDGEIIYTASATFSDGTKVSNSVSVVMPFTNKEALDEEIVKAEAEEKFKDDYTAASWADFEAALDAAKSVLNDVTATQEKVDQALANLEKAYENLVLAPIPEYLQGFNELNGNWYYFVNGNIAYGMNDVLEGTVKGTTGWWYIVNGQVQLNYTGVCNYSNAYGWWYVVNGKVDFGKTGIEQNNFGWWRVVGGKVDFGCNSVEQNDYGWWYLVGGQVQFGYTGVANYANAYGWWYISGGKVDFGKTSIEPNNYGWWRVVGGKVDFGCNSVEQNDYGWWYVVGGQVQFGYTGVANYANAYGWWYISGGQVDFSKTSVEQNNYGWWRVENGKVNFSYTGWARNNFGTWYCVNGKVDFSRS